MSVINLASSLSPRRGMKPDAKGWRDCGRREEVASSLWGLATTCSELLAVSPAVQLLMWSWEFLLCPGWTGLFLLIQHYSVSLRWAFLRLWYIEQSAEVSNRRSASKSHCIGNIFLTWPNFQCRERSPSNPWFLATYTHSFVKCSTFKLKMNVNVTWWISRNLFCVMFSGLVQLEVQTLIKSEY